MTKVFPDSYGRRLVNKLIAATDAYAFRGAQHPDDVPQIEAEFTAAKDKLLKHLDNKALDLVDAQERLATAESYRPQQVVLSYGSFIASSHFARPFLSLGAAQDWLNEHIAPGVLYVITNATTGDILEQGVA